MNASILIVDDEHLSRSYIQDLLQEFWPDAIIAGSVNNTEKAREILNEREVDVIFLDVKMPDENGIEFLESLESKDAYKTVLITAYNEYAIRAIKESAFDYLLKPIDKQEFQVTLDRLETTLLQERKPLSISSDVPYEKASIMVPHFNGFKVILLKDIVYLQASSNYAIIKLIDNSSITVSKPLKLLDERLNKDWFFRVHKSYLVNLHYIDEYSNDDGGKVLLKNGEEVYISKAKLHEFFNAVKKLTNGLKA